MTCGKGRHNSITHRNGENKKSIKAIWKVPNDYEGPITFRYSFVTEYDKFHTNLELKPFKVSQSPPAPPTVSTTTASTTNTTTTTTTCDFLVRNLGDDYCDDEANIEACQFDKGDCCLLDSESKRYCNECLCKEKKESKPEDSKYTGEDCGKRLGERDASFSFTNGPEVSPTKVRITDYGRPERK